MSKTITRTFDLTSITVTTYDKTTKTVVDRERIYLGSPTDSESTIRRAVAKDIPDGERVLEISIGRTQTVIREMTVDEFWEHSRPCTSRKA